MNLWHPDLLLARARVLEALAARVSEPPFRAFVPLEHGVGYDDGAGDHAMLVWVGGLALLKAFDHESPVSRYARDDQQPDPALTEGLPEALGPVLDGLEGEDRTFVAWFADGAWTVRGEPFPADRFLLDGEGAAEWLLDEGFRADPEVLERALAGAVPPDAVALEPVVPPTIAGPTGWKVGEPFEVAVSCRAPLRSIDAVKAVREATGQSLGEIKRALWEGGVVLRATLGPYAFDAARQVRGVERALAEVGVGFEVKGQEVDRDTLLAMMGTSAMFMR